MADLKIKYNKKCGIIKVVFGDPSTDDIIDSLKQASDNFQRMEMRIEVDGKRLPDRIPLGTVFGEGSQLQNYESARELSFDL